jgi:hypothetical protein
MFAGAPDLAGVCARARIPEATDPPALPAGQRALPVASGSGSLVPAPAGEAAVDWRPALAQALRDLGVNAAFRVELAPTHDTPVTTLAAALAAFWDLGLPPPLLALRKPPEDEPFTCQPARLQGAEAVRLAGARWLGEHRRP